MASVASTLDARNTIPARLDKLDVSQAFFAVYVGSNKAEFSRLMNGLKTMSGGQAEVFYGALDDLTWMIEHFFPLRPQMKPEDAPRVKNFIKSLRDYREGYHETMLPHQIREAWELVAA
jgi:hypothetical protein